jgi:hypothetical protein
MHLALLPFNDSADAGIPSGCTSKNATYLLWPLPTDEAFMGNGGVLMLTLPAMGS